ncbi:hypothetical protein [Psychromonas antarctica]|uniref:hypothetical protein n=1 Tax=Psychromonas antarctica TaxID=67573 RepID=UPI001EE7FEA2|nr:hypothetical protein [Psychromonas antarctica]MCG6201887.1 hypothetical protein [Psychromonas antarctica]
MTKQIGILLTSTLLLSIFACDETQQKHQSEQETKQIQQPAPPKVENAISSKEDSWAEAKDSTKQALQQSKKAGEDIWEASKETSTELLNSGKEKSKQAWGEIKEKSNDVLKKSNEKFEQLLKRDKQEALPEDIDDEI